METPICCDKLKAEVTNETSSSILEKDSIFKAAAAVAELPTPDRNNDEAVLNCDSPLTSALESDSPEVDSSSPRTPKGEVFDPFAPGPDHLLLAPQIKKHDCKSKISVVRRLVFDSSLTSDEVKENLKEGDNDNVAEDVVLVDKMYKSLLDAIVTKQTESVLDENEEAAAACSGLATPTKMPLLTGIADTCPDAPKKARPYSNKIDLGLCRKLEF